MSRRSFISEAAHEGLRPVENETILITGATGVLGREVLERARRTGRPLRATTRRTAVPDDPGVAWFTADLTTGAGLDRALSGVGTVIHCASDTRHPRNDVPGLQHLLAAAERAGVGHVVNISIVGVDRVPIGYYRIKLAGERLLATSGIGWTTLRATQFPELLNKAFGVLSRLPVVPVPAGVTCQPVDQGEVADRLVELALGGPAGRVPDIAGPTVYPTDRLARDWLGATARRRPVLPVPLPGRLGARLRAGALTAPDRAVGHRTWEDYLAERVTR